MAHKLFTLDITGVDQVELFALLFDPDGELGSRSSLEIEMRSVVTSSKSYPMMQRYLGIDIQGTTLTVTRKSPSHIDLVARVVGELKPPC